MPCQLGASEGEKIHEHSRSLSPTASRPDFLAFAEGVHMRLPQHRALPPEVVQGLNGSGGWFRSYAPGNIVSPSLATQTGLSWLRLALLEQGMLLPDELTMRCYRCSGRRSPPPARGTHPRRVFRTMARPLCALHLPAEEAPVTRTRNGARANDAPRRPTARDVRGTACHHTGPAACAGSRRGIRPWPAYPPPRRRPQRRSILLISIRG